jgi:hypothetical protein
MLIGKVNSCEVKFVRTNYLIAGKITSCIVNFNPNDSLFKLSLFHIIQLKEFCFISNWWLVVWKFSSRFTIFKNKYFAHWVYWFTSKFLSLKYSNLHHIVAFFHLVILNNYLFLNICEFTFTFMLFFFFVVVFLSY